MIRPFTLLCAALAAGSGLYLYQVKHQAELLDRQIRRIQDQTVQIRERAGVLRAEYALLNDPDRLTELANEHLRGLRPTLPTQWSTIAELGRRLPPVGERAEPPAPPQEPDNTPVARAEPGPAPPPRPAAVAAMPQPARAGLPAGADAALAAAAEAAKPTQPIVTTAVPLRVAPRPAQRLVATANRPVTTAPVTTAPVQAAAAAAPPSREFAVPRGADGNPAHRQQGGTYAGTAPVFAPATPLAASPAAATGQAALAAPLPALVRPPQIAMARPLPGVFPTAPQAPQRPAPAPTSLAPAGYPPPATPAEAVARIARGAPVDPSVPVVASALGMARTMVPTSPFPQAGAATLYTVGTVR